MSASATLGFIAGVTGALALHDLLAALVPPARRRLPTAARSLGGSVDAVTRIGREGLDPGVVERRRLLLGGALCAFLVGAALVGPLVGAALAGAGAWVASRALRARRERYRRAVDTGAAQLSLSIADAIGGGRSLRGALAEAAGPAQGAAGHELRRVAAELQAGARTEHALEAMRGRVRSPRIDLLVAACLLQRRAGGDLPRLLRDGARAMEDEARLEHELRAATAQARFTGLLVVLLPLGGAGLAELASPGWVGGLLGSFLTAWLVGIAVMLQLVAAVLIRRLARVRW